MASQDAFALVDDPSLVGPPGDELPPREEFLRLIGAVDAKASPLLRVILSKCKADAPLADQLTALEQLGRFVVAGPSIPGTGHHPALTRLELLVHALERIPAARRRFQTTLHSVLSQTRGIKLFGEIGLPHDRGLWAETTDRLARRFLPEAPAYNELFNLGGRMIRSIDDLKWLGPLADPLLHRLAAAGGAAWDPVRSSVLDAIASSRRGSRPSACRRRSARAARTTPSATRHCIT